MKKTLSFILAMLMLISAFELSVFALENDPSDTLADYEYYIYDFSEDSYAVITKYNGDDTNIVIPSEIEGHPVKEIGEHAFSMCKAESIIIPETVEIICTGAFSWCSNATSIIIPDSVLLICEDAFASCAKVENFSIPPNIYDIGMCAFYGCKKLTEVYIPKNTCSIGPMTFSGCDSLISIKVDENNSYYDSRDNSNCIIETKTDTLVCATNYSFIPDTVQHIGDNAFSFCTQMESIIIPSSVKTIGYEAFSYCDKLKQLILPPTVEDIGANFTYSTYLRYIVIHNPDCKIRKGYYHIGQFTTIYGYENSTAQEYTHTEFYDSPFVNIDEIIADVDSDNKVTIMDTTLVQRATAHLKTFSDKETVSADTDKDGVISITDATVIQRYIAKIDSE